MTDIANLRPCAFYGGKLIDLQKLYSDFVLRINSMTDEELDASCKQAEEDSQDSQDYY